MTRCQLLLSLLEDAGSRGCTTAELLQAGVGSRYGARLLELRKQGHRITSERIRDGSWRYTLDDVGEGVGHSGVTSSGATGPLSGAVPEFESSGDDALFSLPHPIDELRARDHG